MDLLAHLLVVLLMLNDQCNGDYRDYVLQEPVSRTHRQHFQRSLFPTFKMCEAVDFVTADTTNTGIIGNRTMIWSPLIHRFIFPSEGMISQIGMDILKEVNSYDFAYLEIRFGVPLFFLSAITIALLFALVIPVIGAILFWICETIYKIFTNKLFRKIGRWLLIHIEKRRRKREAILIRLSRIHQNPPRSKFRLPKFFRNYSDEEIPEELQAPIGIPRDNSDESDADSYDMENAYEDVRAEEARIVEERTIAKQQELRKMDEKAGVEGHKAKQEESKKHIPKQIHHELKHVKDFGMPLSPDLVEIEKNLSSKGKSRRSRSPRIRPPKLRKN